MEQSLIQDIPICAVFKKKLRNFNMSSLQCHMQWSPLAPVSAIRIGTMFEKKPSIFEVSFSQCYMQWGLTTII
jgi:hypothetical protein